MPRSIEEISKKSVKELRKYVAEELGITKFKRKDEELTVKSYAQKQELIDIISREETLQAVKHTEKQMGNLVEKPLTIEVLPVEKPPTIEVLPVEEPLTIKVLPVEEPQRIENPQTEKTSSDEKFDYTEYEQLLKKLATKYYQGFQSGETEIVGVRQFAQEQLKRSQTNQSLMDTRLFATVACFKEELIAIASDGSQDGKPNASTVINLRVEILNRIKKAVAVEHEQFTIIREIEGMEPIAIDYLTQSFEAFRSGAIASFSIIAREKRESQGNNFLARRTNTPHANVSNLIDWAIERLKNLPTKSLEWREVALAIMIVTGRRPGEVLGTGVFKAIDETNLEFYGQLKKKGESDEKIYRIPSIGDTSKQVEIAIQWLEMMNKRVIPESRSLEHKQDAAKKCHDRFSRYLSEVASDIIPSRLILAEGASWNLTENRSRIKPYLARQIYLQIISKTVQKAIKNGVSIDPDIAVTYFSGHYINVDGKDANAENYLADIVIDDMDKIQELWQWNPNLTENEIKSIMKK